MGERERRYLVASLPEGVSHTEEIVDRYVTGTRLRLREVHVAGAAVTRTLGHQVRGIEGPAEVSATNFYLDDREWAALESLPAQQVRLKRHLVPRDGLVVVIDEHADGTLLAEIDDRHQPARGVPDWLEVVEDVSDDDRWSGAQFAP